MTFESVDYGNEDEAEQPIKPVRCRCYMPTTAMPPPVITAADQVRRNLRLSAKWARFGRLMVEQLLSEHDAAVERAETAEAQVKRMQAVINEDITAYEAELNDIHKARDHWQDETVRATERAENAEAERNAARRELAEVREQIGELREEWAIRTAAGAESFCATREGALRIAADWTRIRNDGPWHAESRLVGEWKAADDA